MRAHGLPEPRFEAGPGWFRVTFPGPGEHILDLIPEEDVTDPSGRALRLGSGQASGRSLRALGLNDRQIEALALMVNEGKELTNSLYQTLFHVSRRTALRDLTRLVATGWVRQSGTRKGTVYVAQ